MILNLKTFPQMVSDAAVAVQSAASALLNLTPGSALRAILEANASLGMYMQAVFYNVLLTTRLSTSGSSDCDSFGADYGFTRLPASTASGQATIGRFTTTTAAQIPPGTGLTTLDNLVSFTVTTDVSNPLWSASANAYILPITLASATVPILCDTAGAGGNVGAGTITQLSSIAAGLDTVVNALALTNGADAETDAAFKTRFASYIQSLSRATQTAVGYAISTVQQDLRYTIEENVNADGDRLPGHIVITVDDGTGTPSSDVLAAVHAAVELYRPMAVSYDVFGPIVVPVSVALHLIPQPGYTFAALVGPVHTAVSNYINGLSVGEPLAYSRLVQVAYDAADGIANITGLLLDGDVADLIVTPRQVITATAVSIAP